MHIVKVTYPALCYESAHGYCEQRTAWISQLLANYYYKKGISDADLSQKSIWLNMAMKHIRNVRSHHATGFKASKVTLSTTEMERAIRSSLE